MSYARATIVGNLGADPELRYTASGTPVATFSLAVNRTSSRGDQQVKETDWYRVLAYGRLGEACSTHLARGRRVLVSGRLELSRWTTQTGEPRTTPQIIASDILFLDGRHNGDQAHSPAPATLDSADELDDIPF